MSTSAMSTVTQSKFVIVLLYAVQVIVMLYRALRWLVFERTSRITRLAHQLEQLDGQEQQLGHELTRLNEEYLAEASRIQQRRNSLALQRAKVLEQLSQRVEQNGAPVQTVKSIPVIKCDKVSLPTGTNNTNKPLLADRRSRAKPVEPLALTRQHSATGLAVAMWESKSRSPSPCLWQRPRTPEIPVPKTPPATPKIITIKKRKAAQVITSPPPPPPVETTAAPETKAVNEDTCDGQQQQTESGFSKLTGFNLATHRVNEYIDLITESTIREFKDTDEDANKRSQRFRDSIKELYGDPEWRPFINDLKKQYKIFCYL